MLSLSGISTRGRREKICLGHGGIRTTTFGILALMLFLLSYAGLRVGSRDADISELSLSSFDISVI